MGAILWRDMAKIMIPHRMRPQGRVEGVKHLTPTQIQHIVIRPDDTNRYVIERNPQPTSEKAECNLGVEIIRRKPNRLYPDASIIVNGLENDCNFVVMSLCRVSREIIPIRYPQRSIRPILSISGLVGTVLSRFFKEI